MPNKSSTREFWLSDAAPAEVPKCCPKGHALQPWTALPGYCDGCSQAIQHGEQVLDCRPCNWYLCPACSRQASSASAFWGAISSFFGAAGAGATHSPLAPGFAAMGQTGAAVVSDEVEASRILATFCVDYPATRVLPMHSELEGLWDSCQKLNPNAVAEAVSEQLSWSSGDLDWQPRLRALHALEHFHAKGEMAVEVVGLVLNQANGLLQHLTQVPQCGAKASQLILTLMNPLGDSNNVAQLPSKPAAAQASPAAAHRPTTAPALQNVSPSQPAPAAAAVVVAAASALPRPQLPAPAPAARAPLPALVGDLKAPLTPLGDLLDFEDDLIDLAIPTERAAVAMAGEEEDEEVAEARQRDQSRDEEAELAEEPKATAVAQEPTFLAPAFRFRPPAAALQGAATSVGLSPIEDGLSRLGVDAAGGSTSGAAGGVAGLAAMLDMSPSPLKKSPRCIATMEKSSLGSPSVTLAAAHFGA